MFYVLCLEETVVGNAYGLAYRKATSKIFYDKELAIKYMSSIAKSRKPFILDVTEWDKETRDNLV